MKERECEKSARWWESDRTLFCFFPFHFQLHYRRALPYRRWFSVAKGMKCRIVRSEPNRSQWSLSTRHFISKSAVKPNGSAPVVLYSTAALRRLIVNRKQKIVLIELETKFNWNLCEEKSIFLLQCKVQKIDRSIDQMQFYDMLRRQLKQLRWVLELFVYQGIKQSEYKQRQQQEQFGFAKR